MNEFLVSISQNWNAALVCVFLLTLLSLTFLRWYKLKRMFDNDAQFEARDSEGYIERSYRRNIWDLSLFPSMSKVFFRSEKD